MVNRCLPDTFQDPLARALRGRRPQPQQQRRLGLRRLRGAASSTRPTRRRSTSARATCSPARARPPRPRSRTSSGSRTRSRTSSSRSTSTPTAATSCGRRAPTRPPTRETLPAPNIGIERYFFDVADTILARIKEHRNTIIEAERTGPIADVLYSRGGQLGRRPVLPQGHHQLLVRGRLADLRRQPGDGRDHPHRRRRRRLRGLPARRSRPRAATRRSSSPTATSACSRARSQYSRDTTPPADRPRLRRRDQAPTAPPINFRFTWPGEAAVIHYTTDGSTPTLALADVREPGPAAARPGPEPRPARHPRRQVDRGRHQGQRLARPDAAVPDRAGGQRSGGTVPATLSLTLGTPASFGAFTPGVDRDYTAIDDRERDLDGRRRALRSPIRARRHRQLSTARSRCRAAAAGERELRRCAGRRLGDRRRC